MSGEDATVADTFPGIVVASNRGPVTFESGGANARRGSGGLVTALRPIMEGGGGRWIASAMTEGDRDFAARGEGIAKIDGARYHLSYLDFDQADYRLAYDVTANGLLWFAAHGLFDSSRRPMLDRRAHEAWVAYRKFNRRFAEAIAEALSDSSREDGDRSGPAETVVLIQDYHLYLAPAILRALLPEARIGFFLHTPFPADESLSRLPDEWASEILQGILGADLAGFHSLRWASRFALACRARLGTEIEVSEPEWDGGTLETGSVAPSPIEGIVATATAEGRSTRIGVFPLGPDPATLEAEAAEPSVREAGEASSIDDADLIVLRVDRVEPAKNTLRGFHAIDELLESAPELRGRLRHLALLHPSRERLLEYRAYESECISVADRINARWRTASWEPIRVDVADSYPRSLAALKRYDVLLVNSIADGMNLVAREGPLINDRDGVVVVSNSTGAAEVLGASAIVINPFDISATAGAIARALSLSPQERARRSSDLRIRAAAHPPSAWLAAQVNELTSR